MPGRAISGRWRRPSKTRCSQTSSQIATASKRLQKLGEQRELVGANTVPVGFSGLLNSTTLVRGEKAAPSASSVERASRGGCRLHEARHAAGPAHQRQIGVVHRLEQHDLVARLDQGQQRRGERLGRAGGDHHLGCAVELEALPVPVMLGDGGAQLGHAQHRRILVPAVDHRLGRLAPHVLRAGIVREALAEIDRALSRGRAAT